MVKRITEKGRLISVDLRAGVITAVMHEGFWKDRKIRIMLDLDDDFLRNFADETGTLPGARLHRTTLIEGKHVTEHKITITIT